MKDKFQTILLGIFLAFFVFAVFVFSGLLPIGQKKSNDTEIVGNITIWGTFDTLLVSDIFNQLIATNKELNIKYIEKDPETYQKDLLQAFAKGEGPDLFIVSNNNFLQNESFTYEIPYTSYTKRAFQNTFIDGAQVFLDENGVDALPLIVDPLVVFYNKNMLANEGVSTPPLYWDELFDINNKLTKKRSDGTIIESMIALGSYENIENAKDIISMLFIQSGNKIVDRRGGEIFIDIDNQNNISGSLNNELIDFFISFSNPLNQVYSWNRGLINSKDFFTGNSLAFYIGHASELFEIEEINPNLSFDVTEMFQIRNEKNKIVAGDIYALAINKNSKNLQGAFGTAFTLISPDYTDKFAKALSLPPATRQNLLENPTDPYLYSFYKSAISLRTWLDTDKEATDDIFERFVENLISGRVASRDAVGRLQSEMDLTIKR